MKLASIIYCINSNKTMNFDLFVCASIYVFQYEETKTAMLILKALENRMNSLYSFSGSGSL